MAELATVNSVGQALASQLDLDALIELVGERVRETFDADLAYVALHDEAAGQIEFAYYYETGERRAGACPGVRAGAYVADPRVARAAAAQPEGAAATGHVMVGTPSLSYLGVPILVGEKSIGVISVQNIEEEGRFGEEDVAPARDYRGQRRRSDPERASLRRGRTAAPVLRVARRDQSRQRWSSWTPTSG